MKKLFLLFVAVIIIAGCDRPEEITAVEVAEIKPMEKNSQYYEKYPYLQEFHLVDCRWQVVADDNILVKVVNQNLFNLTTEFFAILTYQQGSTIMIYLNKPASPLFILPYFGNADLQAVKLYAIITHI